MVAVDSVGRVMEDSGLIWGDEIAASAARGELLLNGVACRVDTPVDVGMDITLRGVCYPIVPMGKNRPALHIPPAQIPRRIPQPVRVHAGYHKCLTMYSRHFYRRCAKYWFGSSRRFKHYYHRLDAFYADCHHNVLSSVSGHAIDLDRFDDIKVVRFIRDPRDLLISGYFYHLRAAEHWCEFDHAIDADYQLVNGRVPASLPARQSLTDYLNSVSLEEGLLAEMDFRENHYQSMLAWPKADARVRLYKYEDIIGNEKQVFGDIARFFEMPPLARWQGVRNAWRKRARRHMAKSSHIRNPNAGQRRQYLTPELNRIFVDRYGEVLERYGYPLEG